MKKGLVIGLCMLLSGSVWNPSPAGTHMAGFNTWWLGGGEPSGTDGVSFVGEPDRDETETDVQEEPQEEPQEGEWVSLGSDWTITYYCPLECCNDQWAWQTSTQEPMQLHHTIAVDPEVIPYYTHVRIDGLDYEYVAEDCGGGIDGKQIDVLVENCDLANELGVDRNVEVWVRP